MHGARAGLGAVLVEGHVADVVQFVLDVPVLAPQRQQLRGREGGDRVNDLLTQHRAGGPGQSL